MSYEDWFDGPKIPVDKQKVSWLWIPPTPTTTLLVLGLKSIPDYYKGAENQHVEIKGHFEQVSTDYTVYVDKIRPLKPGETMHHPDFKPPKKPPEKTR